MRLAPPALLALAVGGLLVACAAREPVMTSTPVEAKDLIGSEWLAEDIDNAGVLDQSHSTLHFAAADKVDGDTGCNRFTGPLAATGAAIRLGPLATTRRACAPALMHQELRYLQALTRAASLRLDGPQLVLLDESGTPLVRYGRLEATPPPLPVRP